MRADLLLRAVSRGLDIVEAEIAGVSSGHAQRVALLCGLMGKELNLPDNERISLTVCGLLHDSALTEWLAQNDETPAPHCVVGQKNAEALPFPSDISGFILYHHENADGTGYFERKSGEYPFESEVIGIADRLDVEFNFGALDNLDKVGRSFRYDGRFTDKAKELLLCALEHNLGLLKNDNLASAWQKLIPSWDVEYKDSYGIARFIMRVIDYKSRFTARHSSGIADKSLVMSKFYGYGENETAKLYLAAAVHDLGKLTIPSAVLEKPGRLTDDEFITIKSHANGTHDILLEADGFDDVRAWAGNHHEKLDGTGYPFGLKAAELDFNSRLMACLDIYQAVSEERPYHPERSHADTMKILRDMAGLIEPVIVEDIDIALRR